MFTRAKPRWRGRGRRSQSLQPLMNVNINSENEANNSNVRGHQSRRGRGRSGGPRQRGYYNNFQKERRTSFSNDDTSESKSTTGRQNRSQRQYGTGFRVLQQMLSSSPDDVIYSLLDPKNGFQLLVQDSNILKDHGKFLLVLELLNKACKSNSIPENLMKLLNQSFCQTFKNTIVTFISVNVNKIAKIQAEEAVTNLLEICDTYSDARPFEAIGNFEDILQIINTIFIPQFPNLTPLCNHQLDKLAEIKCDFLEKKKEKQSHKYFQDDDSNEPPDNFRMLSVLPTALDIDIDERPFLRKNVVEGKYIDDNHYLDIQFRLLREDFIRPLRNGIAEHRECSASGKKNKNRDINIYKNVKVDRYEFVGDNLIYFVKLEIPKFFNVENTRRLMFGNLVCFSADNFQTMHFGYIVERGPENLRKGLLGVQFEGEPIAFRTKYEMAESKAYFVAFKHVLETLQIIDQVPLPHYLLHVSNDIHPPTYMIELLHLSYDLRVLTSPSMLKKEEAQSILMRRRDINEPQEFDYLGVSQVRVNVPLENWPGATALALDESQRKALYGALTRQLAIIQGPPGTGKTFLGLKLTQVLLHNRHHWLHKKNPILVVCYTNHALDQFLEGMLNFTSSIVRVGSRSKNEALDEFQLRNLAMQARRRKIFPSNVYQRCQILSNEKRNCHSEIIISLSHLKELKNPKGIFSLDFMSSVIPKAFLNQLQNGLSNWLFQEFNPQCMSLLLEERDTLQQLANEEDDEDEEEIDQEEWKDAQEYIAEQELNRMIDLDVDITYDPKNINTFSFYEIRLQDFLHESNKLEAYVNDPRAQSNDPAYVEMHYRYQILLDRIECMNCLLEYIKKKDPISLKLDPIPTIDLHSLPVVLRWKMYQQWIETLIKNIQDTLPTEYAKFKEIDKAHKEMRNQEYLFIMRESSVVGMTTTGAAKIHQVLQALECEIVIIEEAAEILEAHIVTSITDKCKHLILIGDHQQLRPSTTVYELAIKYKLETSLFERMIKNGVRYETLEYQHRMRPSISKLIVPAIYPELKDDVSVHDRLHIQGIDRDLFFVDHQTLESKSKEESTSHENMFEALFIMAICNHLLLQGYEPEKITILTPYLGQFFLLKKVQRSYPLCSAVKVCVVDNFQGEENDIILLSLVRSNQDGKVGFLKIDNRVNVALSRARNGMYIIGNMEQMCNSSHLWRKIRDTLQLNKSLGPSLPIRCVNHPEKIIDASRADDFVKYSPEGGCLLPCSFNYEDCGHSCIRTCHVRDMDHIRILCKKKCLRKLCENDEHLCEKKCYEECGPCMKVVPKTLLCKHVVPAYCHLNIKDIKCPEIVERVLPRCEHTNKMECHKNANSFKCTFDCDTRLDCGHKCVKKCHMLDDPDHLEYNCFENCEHLNKGCNFKHKCVKKCYEECGLCFELMPKLLPCSHQENNAKCHEDPKDIICKKACKKFLSCGHKCPKRCHETCGGCKEMVTKKVPDCQHYIKVQCSVPPTTNLCVGKCTKVLPCGHFCENRCKELCSTKCLEKVVSRHQCPMGHTIKIACYMKNTISAEETQLLCQEKCTSLLSCDHVCRGQCGPCLFGRLHQPCNEPCGKTLVCGHICKSPCSMACPPCNAICEFKCTHNRCRKKCAINCEPCKQNCPQTCTVKEHKTPKCVMKCGQPCASKNKDYWKPCVEPCLNKISKCKHPCIGFCGDPCPPQCRICDEVELTELMLSGNETEEDARFVLLVDCGHAIEVDALEQWLNIESEEIGMKKCPRCQKTIYNLRRYSAIILKAYKDVEGVKRKYFRPSADQTQIKKDIKEILKRVPEAKYRDEIKLINGKVGLDVTASLKAQKRPVSITALEIALLQANSLENIYKIREAMVKSGTDSKLVSALLDFCWNRVMNIRDKAEKQLVNEVSMELRRIIIIPAVNALQAKAALYATVASHWQAVNKLMAVDKQFNTDVEEKVRRLLKDSEKFVGGLGIPDEERKMVLKAMGLTQGHWYKCPNGHIYCIADCGGATMRAKCPDCGASIGGENHHLDSTNAVATEMDGARHAAWSEHNNLANYDHLF